MQTLCSLAASPESWCDLRATDDLDEAAAELAVTEYGLRQAIELLPRVGELADRERHRARRLDCRILTRFDTDYPMALFDLGLPPPVLYCRGQLPRGPAIAIVGSRRMGATGKQAAQLFSTRIAAAGVVIVSGFARGIDSTAHQAALDAGGKTVAVLGCGLDIDYPRGNGKLADAIADEGALISEFALRAEPRAWRFPVRNRIIASLSEGTLVVQATPRSGSLITAHQAMELGRNVFAVPGSIFDDDYRGTNRLIRDGAFPVCRPRDVLESLSLNAQQELFPAGMLEPEPAPVTAPSGRSGRVLAALSTQTGRTLEDVAERARITVEATLGILLELELAGSVQREPGPVYRR